MIVQKSVLSYAALSAGSPLEQWSYEPGALGPAEVEVEVTHCGICHTDLHLIDNDLGISAYPLVPGHEIVGIVTDLGNAVHHLARGQRVGIGWQRGSCLECEWCLDSQENLCTHSRPTCLAGYGGFARSVRSDSHFAVPIPDGLSSESAAPMLCAGITVFNPLKKYGRKSMRVGVIGIGGLGHLALHFARAMDMKVYAISTSPDKQEEALRFGADEFVVSSDVDAVSRLAGKFNLLLSTATAELDWPAWLNVLRPNGTFCLLGASPGPVTLPVLPMIFGQYCFTASVVGSPARIFEMLQFAADHGIETAVETCPMQEVNRALTKVRQNQARYRVVLTA